MVRKRRPAVTVTQLALALKISKCNIYRWVRNGLLSVIHLRSYHQKNKIIKREDAVQLLRDWRRSCTPTKASNLLGVSRNSAEHLIKKNILETIKLMGLTRVMLSSIDSAKNFKNLTDQDVIYPEKKGFAKYSREKIREISLKSLKSPKRYHLTLADKQTGGSISATNLHKNWKAKIWTREEFRAMSLKGGRGQKKKSPTV